MKFTAKPSDVGKNSVQRNRYIGTISDLIAEVQEQWTTYKVVEDPNKG
jgi:hypothetical protein